MLRDQRPLQAGIRCRRARLDVAEDVAQEAVVRACASLAALVKPESFFAGPPDLG